MGNQNHGSKSVNDPLQSYINYVTKKNNTLWEEDQRYNNEFINSSPKQSCMFSCFPFLFRSTPSKPPQLWEQYFLDQCKVKKNSYDWAKKLSQILKKNRQNEFLESYLSDIRWFDFNQGIYEINDRKTIKRCSFSSRSQAASLDMKVTPNSSKSNEELKELLKETPICNEEFYKVAMPGYWLIPDEKTAFKTQSTHLNSFSLSNNNNIPMRHYSCLSDFQNNTLVQQNICNIPDENEGRYSKDNETNMQKEIILLNMKKCLFHYKQITEKIEKHLSDYNRNIFAILKKSFIEYFIKKYEKNKHKDKDVQMCYYEIKEFIKIFQETLCKFYKLNDYKKVLDYFLFTNENLSNFITSIFFDDIRIYTLIFEMQRKIDLDSENNLIMQYQIGENLLLSDFDVSDKYCLNEKTLQLITLKKNKKNSNNNNDSVVIYESDENNTRKSTILKPIEKISKNLFLPEEDTQYLGFTQFDRPFQKSIKSLKKIEKMKSPLHKLKIITLTSEMINFEIKEFYKKCGLEFNDVLGADEILGIYIYIICQAKINNLITHCEIIQKFLTNNLRNSVSGYFLVTIQVALKYILELQNSKDFEEKIMIRTRSIKEFKRNYHI